MRLSRRKTALFTLLLLFLTALPGWLLLRGLFSVQRRRVLQSSSPEACAAFARDEGCRFADADALALWGDGDPAYFLITNFAPLLRDADIEVVGYGARAVCEDPALNMPGYAFALYVYPAGQRPATLHDPGPLSPAFVHGAPVTVRELRAPDAPGPRPPAQGRNAVTCIAQRGAWEYAAQAALDGPYTPETRRALLDRLLSFLEALLPPDPGGVSLVSRIQIMYNIVKFYTR